MLRRISLAAALILILAACAGQCFAWRFAVIADSRGSTNGVNVAELTKIVGMINTENAEFVIFPGDACTGSSSDATLSSQMDTWLSVMNNLNCPWWFSPGNHEIQTSTSQDVLRTKVDQPLNGPASDLEMVYSFDYENAHFVSLNSNHYGQAHHVQRSWLSADLAATNKPHKFVFAHEPAYPAGPHIGSSLDAYPAERDDFWNIMTAYSVGMYFTGHEHLYQRTKHGSIYQIIAGTCGAPIYSGVPNTVAAYHYVIVEIDGNDVDCWAKYDDGTTFDTWSYSVTPPMTCDDVKFVPDYHDAILNDKVVTYARGSVVYVEEDDRTAAFRVNGASGVVPGDRVNVYGHLETISTGERQINGTVTVVSSGNPIPRPIALTNRDLLGGPRGYNPGAAGAFGHNTSAMLVRIYGKVTKTYYGHMFYLDDGSGIVDGTELSGTPNLGVRVVAEADVSVGQFVTVTGICSCMKNPAGEVIRLLYATEVH